MTFEWGTRTYVMGILNVTPDSFSGDGLLSHEDIIDRAVVKARRFVDDGADIIDIGGESTRPGSVPVTAAEELERVIPVISAIREMTGRPALNRHISSIRCRSRFGCWGELGK